MDLFMDSPVLHLRVLFLLFWEAPHPFGRFPFPEADADENAYQNNRLRNEVHDRIAH